MNRDGGTRADEAAARWLARLNARSVTTEELDQFYAWRRDPANAAAYAHAEQVWRDTRELESDPQIAAAIEDALERPQSRSLWASPSRRRMALAGLSAIPVGLAVAAGWWGLAPGEIHETAAGERLAFALSDGTRVQLNGDSRVESDFNEAERNVDLKRGEAVFTVKRDPARPFIVHVNGQSVRALGTSFSTRRADETLRVVLIEGEVEVRSPGVSAARLARAGATATARPGKAIELGNADAQAETAWTRGKLLFRQTPLASAIAQVNRYAGPRIELDDATLGAHRVDGTFDAGDTDSFVAAVTTIFDLDARREGNRIIFERKSDGDAKKSSRKT